MKTIDFSYDSTATSPYATAPSSPQSTIPFFWEDKPGIPKQQEHDKDFAFGYLGRHSISAADELFDHGKIKPLKPPPRLHCSNTSPRSSKSPKQRFKEALSPKSKTKDFDPFFEAFKQTPCEQPQRGREPTTKTDRYKVSRSLSPFRVSGIVTDRKSSKGQAPTGGLTWYNKWNFKNLLLFRSACDGKDSLNKYTMLEKNESVSFRSTDSGGTMKVSADVMDSMVAEEMRKKGNLRYKFGLMGCLRFQQNAGRVMKQ